MLYLMTHSTHFFYGYMASDIWQRTILIVGKETRCHHIGYSFRLAARVLLYASSHRQYNAFHHLCYTSRGALAGTRNSLFVLRQVISVVAALINLCTCPISVSNLSVIASRTQSQPISVHVLGYLDTENSKKSKNTEELLLRVGSDGGNFDNTKWFSKNLRTCQSRYFTFNIPLFKIYSEDSSLLLIFLVCSFFSFFFLVFLFL